MAGRNLNLTDRRQSQRGYTLIEILIVVAILGVLAAVAFPSYQSNVRSGNRSVALAGLLDLANRQEQYYLDNRTYADDLTNLGFDAGLVFSNSGDSAIAVNKNQMLVASTAADRIYFLQVTAADATSFAVSAVPQQGQTYDAECGTLSLTSAGAKTETGTGSASDCW